MYERAGAIRIGDTIRKPTRPGAPLVAELLTHLETVGFEKAPRYLGVDSDGRSVFSYVEGWVPEEPPWIENDEDSARALGRLAALLREVHDATAGFRPSPGLAPGRPLPIPGATWCHGDATHTNTVFDSRQFESPVALIDWEFAALGDPIVELAGLLAFDCRGPKSGADDNRRRERAVELAVDAIAAGYGATEDQRLALPSAASVVIADFVDFNHPTASTAAAWK